MQIEDLVHPSVGYQINIISKYFIKHGHNVTIIMADLKMVRFPFFYFFGNADIYDRYRDYTKRYGE